MTKLDEILVLMNEARNLQKKDRGVVQGITYSINKLSELRAELERRINERTLLINRLSKEADKHRL